MEDTYIKLYRKINKWEWADNPYMVAIWIHLLVNANYTPNKWHGIDVDKGQLVTSIASLSVKTGLSVQQTRTCLSNLRKCNQITIKSTNKYSIITICKYEDYQSLESVAQQTNNKQITNEQQTNNKQLTTLKEREERKEREEYKKENILKEKSFTPPTVAEVAAYCQERNNGIDAQRFVDFYQTKGWMVGKNKMKDWKAAVRTWERKDKEQQPQEQPKQIPGCIWSRAEQRYIPI